MGYDVIGDIHGQADKLDALLCKLGYAGRRGTRTPPHGRQAVFLGDLIDRGPAQVEVVRTVRSMIDAGHALTVMGNHEFNAIGFLTERRGAPGEFLRVHDARNVSQHVAFLDQVGAGSALHHETIAWFRSLPPTLDLGGIRVVHAWWHRPYVELVTARATAGRLMDDDFLQSACTKGSAEWEAMEGLTKGLDVLLPAGAWFTDHSGVRRHEVRTKWWHEAPVSFRDVAILEPDERERLPDQALPPGYPGLPNDGSPIFVGHYWMSGTPRLQSARVACVDYSAAKDGPLVCYRWDGETDLDDGHFVAAG